jgi:hypothetical protein
MSFKKLVNQLECHRQVLFLSLLAMMFLRCDTKELDFMQPYQFVNDDFDNVGELPPVIEPEPVIEEPELPQVVEPEEAQTLFNDVDDAEDEGDLEESSITILEKVAEFVFAEPEESSENVQEQANNLSEDEISEFFDENFEISADLLEVAENAKQNADIGLLFPGLNIPLDLEDFDFDARKDFNTTLHKELFLANLRTATLVGPCADAARTAYQSAISRLETTRNTQLATAETNYQNRLNLAQQRLGSRNAASLSLFQERLREGQLIISRFLRAANSLSRFNVRLASFYRYYAFIYMINLREVYGRSYTLSLLANQNAFNREISDALVLRNQSITTINTNYNTELVSINNVLQAALNTCHNQGAGN